MHLWIKRLLVCLAPAALTAGCLGLGASPAAMPRPALDTYELIENTGLSISGCQFQYRVYNPLEPRTPTSVILGHGFLRDQDNLVGLSRALANSGVRVVTLEFCNMRPWNGHHERNARDMRTLATKLNLTDDIVFGGFSAGALAAVLASDNNTRAILALDLVDQNDLGLRAIRKLATPLIGLSGPASGCNANNNAAALFQSRIASSPTVTEAQPLSRLISIDSASHCEFESPSNWLCEIACGDDDSAASDAADRAGIIDQTIDNLFPYLTNTQAEG